MSEVPTSPEQSQKPSELSRGQAQVIAGASDVIRNATALAAYRELRGIRENIPSDTEILDRLLADLSGLDTKLTIAEEMLQQGQTLPIIIEGGKEMVDFKYYNWNPEEKE